MTHQVVPVRLYVTIYVALIVLTISTTAIAEIDLGEWNIVAAMTIAVVKGSLVVWFFMHLRQSSSLTKLVAAAGLFWFAILITFTLSDYQSRGWLPGGHWF